MARHNAINVAVGHGTKRLQQGYTIPMLLVESAFLESTIGALLQEHLLVIDISTLIPAMCQIAKAINCSVETAVRAFLAAEPDSHAA